VVENIVTLLLALFLGIGSLGVVFSRRPASSVVSFFAVTVSIAGLFAILNQTFLFVSQIMIGVGAVVVVTAVAVATVNLDNRGLPSESRFSVPMVVTAVTAIPLSILLYRSLVSTMGDSFPPVDGSFGSIEAVAERLFGHWALPFEILSILLLAAMAGAVAIARKEKK
jgi:NADH-quinone oxidoreductase subunit J